MCVWGEIGIAETSVDELGNGTSDLLFEMADMSMLYRRVQ